MPAAAAGAAASAPPSNSCRGWTPASAPSRGVFRSPSALLWLALHAVCCVISFLLGFRFSRLLFTYPSSSSTVSALLPIPIPLPTARRRRLLRWWSAATGDGFGRGRARIGRRSWRRTAPADRGGAEGAAGAVRGEESPAVDRRHPDPRDPSPHRPRPHPHAASPMTSPGSSSRPAGQRTRRPPSSTSLD